MLSQQLYVDDAGVTDSNQIVDITPALQSSQRRANSNHVKKKIVSLIFSSLVALAAGTPYLYGVYSPQLISRCGFSAISSSYLSFSGNVGSSIGGFFAGLLIDTYGIKAGLILGALLQFTGFFIFYLNYKYFIHNFFYLILSMYSIGFGSVLAYFATIKVSTVNFPKHRGLANALPVSAYGLAALFYALISTIWFSEDIQGLLKFIAVFSGVIIFASTFFIKIFEVDDDDGNVFQPENDRLYSDENIDFNNDSNQPREGHSTFNLRETMHDIEVGAQYLMKGHRGSFAQLSNVVRQNSYSSLFSNTSIHSSVNYSSKNSSLSSNTNHDGIIPLSFNAGSCQNGSNLTNMTSSSPLEFRTTRLATRSDSYRLGTSQNSLPRLLKNFSNLPQRNTNDLLKPSEMAFPTSTDTNITDEASSEQASTVPTQDHLNKNNLHGVLSTPKSFYGSVSTLGETSRSASTDELPNASINKKKLIVGNQSPTIKQHIWMLFTDKLFILHYILNATYCAIGQNYIYGIGFIVHAQVDSAYFEGSSLIYMLNKALPNADTAVAYQALQVSIISFSNFLGRLIAGPMSDFIHKKHHMNKLYVIIISLLFLLFGQISLFIFDEINYLVFTSFLIGISYGAIYATMPSIAADLFGSKNFATTWSLIGTGPISIFLVLSHYFGYVYDLQSEWKDIDGDKYRMCLKRKACYSGIFKTTTFLCFILLIGYVMALYLSKHR